MWIALILGFIAGLVGTPHCLGMCGGFPLYLSSESRGRTIMRQTAFVAGKTLTYGLLGALASAAGSAVLKHPSPSFSGVHLRLVLGALAAVFGVLMLGLRSPGAGVSERAGETGVVSSLITGLMGVRNPAGTGVLGLVVGFMPCPLPIGMLVVAAVMHHVPHGTALMAGLGLGSAPSLTAVGMCSVRAGRRLPMLGIRAAGAVILVIGLLIFVLSWLHPSVP